MAKYKQSILIAWCKKFHVGLIKQILDGEGVCLIYLITNQFSQISFHQTLPQISFFYKMHTS